MSRRISIPDTADEISALATTMNSMLTRLDSARATQLRFLGDASHELRSPIATIAGIAEIAQLTQSPIDLETVETILAPESARMQRLVDDLLASASAQEDSSYREEIDLDDLVLAEQHRLKTVHPELKVDGSIHPARIQGNSDALLRALRNLTDNALKYCNHHIRISLEVTPNPQNCKYKQALLTVEDDGPGIPDSAKEHVFTRFGRTDSSRARATGGAGLGLSILKDIVQGHGGSVELQDSALGGACFKVRLPIGGEEQEKNV